MKLCKKGVTLLLAALLLILAACGQNASSVPGGKTAMGRYIEERWELPLNDAYISVLTIRPDGKIYAIINGTEPGGENYVMQAFTTSDGKDWVNEDISGIMALLDKYADKYASITDMAYGSGGECFMLYGMVDEGSWVTRAARMAQDGSVQDIELEEKKAGEYFFPVNIKAGGDGDLYIGQYNGKISRFSADGKFKVNIGGVGTPEFAFYDSQLAVINYGRHRGGAPDTFALYNVNTGGLTRDIGFGLLGDTGDGQRVSTSPDGALYVANTNGIHRLAPEGTTWERIVDGALCSLSIPSVSLDKFIPYGDNMFLTLVREDNKPALINYVYSANTPTRPTTELTVAVLKKNATLLQAAGEFRRQNPDTVVTIQTLLDGDSSVTAADAIRALNTQLLAGKGPDILLLDGLPIDSYIEKGVLADMNAWLKPIIEQELLPNIAGVFEKDGKIYAIPTRFSMPTIWGEKEAVAASSSLESLAKYAETHLDSRLLFAMDRKALFQYFYDTSAPAWLNGGKLDEKLFIEYLELIKRLSDTRPEAKPKDFKMNAGPEYNPTGTDMGGILAVVSNHASQFGIEVRGFTQLAAPNGAISAINGIEVNTFSGVTSVSDDVFPSHIALLPGQVTGVFIPRGILGISASGKQQDLAIEFIKTVLAETVQSSDMYEGLPVNKAVIEANIVSIKDHNSSTTWDDSEVAGEDETPVGKVWTYQQGWPSPGVRRAVVSLTDKLDTPYLPDDTLTEMILRETQGFFNGTKSTTETAAAVAERLELYLAE